MKKGAKKKASGRGRSGKEPEESKDEVGQPSCPPPEENNKPDESVNAQPEEQPEEKPKAEPSKSKKEAANGAGKRTRASKAEPEEEHKAEPSEKEAVAGARARKRTRVSKAEPSQKEVSRKRSKVLKVEKETEYFQEKRNLEDLWKHAFPVGLEWDQMQKVYQYNWNFSNLEDAFEEGGELYNKKVYLFGATEAEMLPFQGETILVMFPVVVAVISPFPPSDKIGVTSVQCETEEIIPMKEMKMDWVPYIPLEQRESQVEKLKKSQIFILGCTQRRAGLKHLKADRVKKFEYCIPYFYNPLKEDELEQSTEVEILFPLDPQPLVISFDWEMDQLSEFVDQLIEDESLPADQKDPFKDFIKQKVREAKKSNNEAKEARKKALEEMSPETRLAYENMRFYKFYPVKSPDTPDLSGKKSSFINRYYGKAHQVF